MNKARLGVLLKLKITRQKQRFGLGFYACSGLPGMGSRSNPVKIIE
jgi:hypothetical protein